MTAFLGIVGGWQISSEETGSCDSGLWGDSGSHDSWKVTNPDTQESLQHTVARIEVPGKGPGTEEWDPSYFSLRLRNRAGAAKSNRDLARGAQTMISSLESNMLRPHGCPMMSDSRKVNLVKLKSHKSVME